MRNKKRVLILAIVATFVMGVLFACSPQGNVKSSQSDSSDTSATEQTQAMTPQEEMLSMQGVKLIETEHSGLVQELEDGTQIMPAPYFVKDKGMYGQHYVTGEGSDGGGAEERNGQLTNAGTGLSTVDYNVDVLAADKRGCNACHVSLIESLNTFDPEHAGLASGDAWLDVKSTDVTVCISCHTTDWDYAQSEPDFGEMIHTMHGSAVGEEKATCFQCHATEAHAWSDPEDQGVTNMLGQPFSGEPTEWKLWEEVKYDQMKGIVNVSNASGEFSFTQDEVTPHDQLFNESWLMYTSEQVAEAEGVESSGLDSSFSSLDDEKNAQLKEDIFNNWEFGIQGEVNSPVSWKLGDLIQQATDDGAVKTVKMKEHCGITKLGGWQIGQVEVTGIPVDWLVEQAGGYTENAKYIDGESLDSSPIEGLNMGLFIGSTPIDWTSRHDVLVVYEINGEKLDWANGFPLQLWIGAAAADAYMKQLKNIVITSEESRMGSDTTMNALCMGPIQYPGFGGVKANCAIVNTYEGQVVEAGKPYTFSGYLDGWYEQVGGIKVSMDDGATWTTYETPDTDPQQWVTWEFTWDVPDQNAAYVLEVKPFLADGSETRDSVNVMINAVQGGKVE